MDMVIHIIYVCVYVCCAHVRACVCVHAYKSVRSYGVCMEYACPRSNLHQKCIPSRLYVDIHIKLHINTHKPTQTHKQIHTGTYKHITHDISIPRLQFIKAELF